MTNESEQTARDDALKLRIAKQDQKLWFAVSNRKGMQSHKPQKHHHFEIHNLRSYFQG